MITGIRIDLMRQFRDINTWMFVVVLPCAMVLLFGKMAGQDAPDVSTMAMVITASMGSFSAATCAAAISGSSVQESLAGWGRQLALSGQSLTTTVVSKVLVATLVSSATTLVVFLCGYLGGAEASSWRIWLYCYLIVLGGSMLFAVYGFAAVMWFRSETAVGVSASLVTFFGFFGNAFVPLSGSLLDISRFTPMWGYVALARYPISEGYAIDGTTVIREELWWMLLNVGAWLVIFAVAAYLGARRALSQR